MQKFENLEQFLGLPLHQPPLAIFIIHLLLCAVLATILHFVYVRYGSALSNRKLFARNFLLLSMTTMIVISIVKSSLALSLGLVGALSIVRFRAAIKEPEELSFLFLAMAIGLGLGAGQRGITILGVGIITILFIFRQKWNPLPENETLFISITTPNENRNLLKDMTHILQKHAHAVNLRRFDETKEKVEATFIAEFRDIDRLTSAQAELKNLHPALQITFLDKKGLI